jgi:hypothetical protein
MFLSLLPERAGDSRQQSRVSQSDGRDIGGVRSFARQRSESDRAHAIAALEPVCWADERWAPKIARGPGCAPWDWPVGRVRGGPFGPVPGTLGLRRNLDLGADWIPAIAALEPVSWADERPRAKVACRSGCGPWLVE